MATRKSTTKAKTKSTKTTRSKSVAAKTANQTRKSSINPVLMHKLSIVGNLILAALAVMFMAPVVFPLTLGYLTSDELLSKSETVFVPADRVQLDVELRWILVGLLVFSALYSLLILTRWRKSYEKGISKRIYFWRWVYLAASSSVTIIMIAILSGIYDLLALKVLAGVTTLGFAFAWLADRQNEKVNKPVRSAWLLGLLSVALPWLMIGAYALATSVYGLIRLPWFVYAAQGVTVVGLLLIFFNQWMSFTKQERWKDYAFAERGYILVSQLMQMAVAVILIVGFSG